ncbi:MAG: SAM-dependent methyltransferase [Gemmatimonadaceae bacterium]
MAHRSRPLDHEYELYVEREIENYKESIPRRKLLGIGDLAVKALAAQQQLALTEVLLCAEVDRIIRKRVRVTSYSAWCKRRVKTLKEYKTPGYWRLRPDGPLARAVARVAPGHVLVAGTGEEGPALYLAANGCAVTALDTVEDAVERVMNAALDVGLSGRVRGLVADLSSWTPDIPLNGMVCASAALSTLSSLERARVIERLQQATARGGLHLVSSGTDGDPRELLDELTASYQGWRVAVESEVATDGAFLAQKELS